MPRRPTGWFDDKSGRWYARLGEMNERSGRRRAVMLRGSDGQPLTDKKAEAQARAAVGRIVEEREAAERRAVGPSVADVCREFIAWHAENGSAERTVKDHHYHLSRFCRFEYGGVRYADRPAAEIGPEDVWRLDDHMGSLRLLYASVIACWNWAARPVKGRDRARLIPENPLFRMKKPPRGKVTRKRVPWETVRHLLRFAAGRAKGLGRTRKAKTVAAERLRVLCLRFMATTGCRPGEAASLEWGDLDLSRNFCVIPAERTKTRKTGKDRRFAVRPRLAQALDAARRSRAAHPTYVFVPAWTRARGTPTARELIVWWRERLKPAAEEAGVPVPAGMTLYWLRHEYQSIGLEVAGADELSAVVGNSPKILLGNYTHQADEAARDVEERVSRRRRSGGK